MTDEQEKLTQLKARIDSAQKATEEVPGISAKYYALTASRVTVELVAGVIVGCGIGYYLDKWLGTRPLFFIALMFLGVAAAIINIYKLSAREAARAESLQGKPEVTPEKTAEILDFKSKKSNKE